MAYAQNHIFNRKLLKKAIDGFNKSSIENLEDKIQTLGVWREAIETAVDSRFLMYIFRDVLGYKEQIANPQKWNLSREQKTKKDAARADGALGFFTSKKTDIRAVIELKGGKTDLDARQHRQKDRRTPVEQAFSYARKSGKKCNWVVVSNYREVRLYHSDSSGEYERFDIAELADDESEFKRFYFLLSFENLLREKKESRIEKLYKDNEAAEEAISKRFYSQYKQLRLNLFEHIKLNNPQYDELLLLEKTQKLLDRFIFICFCEDTGLLPANIFRSIIKKAEDSFSLKPWDELRGLFKAIDQGYPRQDINAFNGGLFAEDAILDSGSLKIEGDIFEELGLISEYDFESDLSVNILGHIFEQSISDLEKLRSKISGQDVKSKVGKRKKDGIFYTPEYITRYIVENSVGGWLEDGKRELGIESLPELTAEDYDSIKEVRRKDREYKHGLRYVKVWQYNDNIKRHIDFWQAYKERLMNIKVLDPACGSGAFLNQAFDFFYREGNRVNEALASLQYVEAQLDIDSLDKHILSNNLYGVDLNRESVEITKLSLWIKTAGRHSQLTVLDDNIKCGNSLIDDPEIAGNKAFDWEKEFPEIMGSGGFDVVIGNPPYVRQEMLSPHKPSFEKQYSEIFHGVADLYVYFIGRGYEVLKPEGFLSYILPNKWMRANYGKPLRSWLKKSGLASLADFGDLPVFSDATTYPCIMGIRKAQDEKTIEATQIKDMGFSSLDQYIRDNSFKIGFSGLTGESWTLANPAIVKTLKKIQSKSVTLKERGISIYRGISTGLNEAFVIDRQTKDNLVSDDPNSEEIIKPFLAGRDIKRYRPLQNEKYIIFVRRGIDIEKYPAVKSYLKQFQNKLTPRDGKSKSAKGRKPGKYKWYEIQDAVAYYNEFEKPKIVCAEIAAKGQFTFDVQNIHYGNTAYILSSDSRYLLGLLNSRLVTFCFSHISSEIRGGFLRWFRQYMELLPIKAIDSSNPDEQRKHDYIAERATIMLEKRKELETFRQSLLEFSQSDLQPQKITKKLENWTALDWEEFKKELVKCKVKFKSLSIKERKEWQEYFKEQKKEVAALQQTISKTDKEIDQMVYELYGLTEEEIRIVEEADLSPILE